MTDTYNEWIVNLGTIPSRPLKKDEDSTPLEAFVFTETNELCLGDQLGDDLLIIHPQDLDALLSIIQKAKDYADANPVL